MTKDKLKLLEEFISEQKRFKVEGYNGEIQSLKEFIDSFTMGDLSQRVNTFEDGSPNYTRKGSWRSVIDVIVACQVHHNATIQDVIDIFKQAREEKTIKGHYCDNIRRMVLRTYCSTWSMFSKPDVLLDYNLKEVTYEDFME